MPNNPNHVRLAEQQPHRAKIFISCGQASEEERSFAIALKEKLESRVFNFKVFVAASESTIKELDRELLDHLKTSDYFLCINFCREIVSNASKKECFYRESLYTNQEIAMAAAVGFSSSNMLILSHRDIVRDGLLKTIITNDCVFDNIDKLSELVFKKAQERGWSSNYSRTIVPLDVQFNNILYTWKEISKITGQRRCDWLAWVDVKNCRKDFVATNCMLHLKHIFDNEGNELPNDEPYPLKCCWVNGYSHTIFPEETVRFDLLAIEDKTHNVFLRSTADYHPRHDYIISGKGIYQLEYELCADMFPIKTFYVELAVGMKFPTRKRKDSGGAL